MNNTRYKFSPLFLFRCFSQFAAKFTFTSEILSYYYYSSDSRQTQQKNKKSLMKTVEHNLEEAFSDVI